MTPRRKICVVTATRAEYGLLFWLLKALEANAEVELQLVVTGTHLSASFGMTVRQIEADGFAISDCVSMLLHDDSPRGIAKSMGLATIGFADAFARLKPDIVVLLGDRYELLAAAQTALVARIPIAHIHGGEATEGAIDEAIRHAITKMSHLHFVAAEAFRRRVVQLGEAPERIWVVGATGLDNVERLPLLTREQLSAHLGIELARPTFLITYHPVTLLNEDPGQAMAMLLNVMDETGGTLVLTGVNADTGASAIRQVADKFARERPGRVALVESLGSLRYLSAIRHADAVVGNSSSGLLEAPALGTPTIDIGDRQRGRLRAESVVHCEANEEDLRRAVETVLSQQHRDIASKRKTPYGTPGAADRIAEVLTTCELAGIVVKRFHDLCITSERT